MRSRRRRRGSALAGVALARTSVLSAELPIGILTICVGGPFFFWLLARRRGRDMWCCSVPWDSRLAQQYGDRQGGVARHCPRRGRRRNRTERRRQVDAAARAVRRAGPRRRCCRTGGQGPGRLAAARTGLPVRSASSSATPAGRCCAVPVDRSNARRPAANPARPQPFCLSRGLRTPNPREPIP
jgi:hypothetical protein